MIQQLKLLPLVAGETVEQKVVAFRNMEDEVWQSRGIEVTYVDGTILSAGSEVSPGHPPGHHEHTLLPI